MTEPPILAGSVHLLVGFSHSRFTRRGVFPHVENKIASGCRRKWADLSRWRYIQTRIRLRGLFPAEAGRVFV